MIKLFLLLLQMTAVVYCKGKAVSSLTMSSPIRVCVLVEPSPFTYTCGYKNRFQALFNYLHHRQDAVEVVTTEVVTQDKPSQYLGFPVHCASSCRR